MDTNVNTNFDTNTLDGLYSKYLGDSDTPLDSINSVDNNDDVNTTNSLYNKYLGDSDTSLDDTNNSNAIEDNNQQSTEKESIATDIAVGMSPVALGIGAKIAGKASKKLGASLMKKVPIASLGAGLYFAYKRLKKREYGSAAAEALSGLLGCIPGAGTAVSTAIDIGLVAHDLKKELSKVDASTEEKKAIYDTTMQSIVQSASSQTTQPKS